MPEQTSIPLSGIALLDAVGGTVVDLGSGPSRTLLSVIRHRY